MSLENNKRVSNFLPLFFLCLVKKKIIIAILSRFLKYKQNPYSLLKINLKLNGTILKTCSKTNSF